MARIPMTNGFVLIPEGTHIFRIYGVDYQEDFGNLSIYLINAQGLTHIEKFNLKSGNQMNEKAMNAFSFFAKTAMQDYGMEDIDPDQLVGRYICCDVVHTVQPSNKPNAKPGATVTFANLGNKYEADGFDTTPVPVALTKTLKPADKPATTTKPKAKPAPAPVETPKNGLDLDALLS